MTKSTSSLAKLEGWLVDKYSSTPYVQALAGFAVGAVSTAAGADPILAGIAGTTLILIDAGFRDMARKRQEILFDELAKGEQYLSEEIIKKEEFIQAFILIHRGAIRTRRIEKIQRFARILLTGIQSDNLESDDLEEFINILDGLSNRELKLLKLLKKWEDRFPLQVTTENHKLQYQFPKYWNDFETEAENQLGIKATDLPAKLASTTRTGLYNTSLGPIYGLQPGQGLLTPRFSEFIRWIDNETLIENKK
ncbi:MAG: hypothetical protein H0X30_06515 [Anaerolineae bacterium]|nr:hypothetical protein [Anaerolineae bacterium]